MQHEKQKVKIEHLVNWYFGNFCAKCGKIDLESEDFGKKCFEKLQKIKDNVKVEKMNNKQFVNIVRNSLFCHPTTRKFSECSNHVVVNK